MTAPAQKGEGAWRGRPGGTPEAGRGWRSPVQLGVLHQSVGVPVTDEGSACEADEALGVVFQLPGHLEGSVCVSVCVLVVVRGGGPLRSSAAPSAPVASPLCLLSEGQTQTNVGAELAPQIGTEGYRRTNRPRRHWGIRKPVKRRTREMMGERTGAGSNL